MQFQIKKALLNQALNRVSRLASVRMPLPILNNILLETKGGQLYFSVTDLELGIKTSVSVEVGEESRFTVPARILHEFVQSTGEDSLVGTVSDGANLLLKGDQTEVKIRGLDASEFPALPFQDGQPTFSIAAHNLKEAFDLVSYASALDDTRPALSGVYLAVNGNELTLAATDSYRLAERQLKLTNPATRPCSAIVPKRTIMELSRLLADTTGDISVFVGDNQIECGFAETKMVSRLIEGTYPAYKSIIPDGYKTRVTAHMSDLISALKTSQLFAREVGNLITLTMLEGKGVTIQSLSSQKGEAVNRFTAITEGEEAKIAFNVKFLLDALSVMPADNVFLEFNGPDRPVVCKMANTKEYLALVMPLKTDS